MSIGYIMYSAKEALPNKIYTYCNKGFNIFLKTQYGQILRNFEDRKFEDTVVTIWISEYSIIMSILYRKSQTRDVR